MKKILFLISTLALTTYSNAQIQSHNKNTGFVITNDIVKVGDNIYACGSLNNSVNINGVSINGKIFNSPFISRTSMQNSSSLVISPVKSLTGYSEFTHIYNFGGEIYLTGIFNNKILVKGDSLYAKNNWDAFVVKLDNNDSVEWYKVITDNSNNFAPSLEFDNNKIYSISKTGNAQNDSLYTSIQAINSANGSLDWKREIKGSKQLISSGCLYFNDTLNVYSNVNNTLLKSIMNNSGNIISQNNVLNTTGYLVANRSFNNNSFWLYSSSNNNQYTLQLASNANISYSISNIMSSDYFGACEPVDYYDSLIVLVGFYQGVLKVDSVEYSESDTSNSFMLTYNVFSNKIVDFNLLPYKNIFKTVMLDSTVYFISNYIDGTEDIKRSGSFSNRYNNDFKISYFKAPNLRKKRQPIKEFANLNREINIYPNTNSGSIIKICCIEKNELRQIILYNSIGQTIPVDISISSNVYEIKPLNQLSTGVYLLEVKFPNNETSTYKIIVK